MNQKDVTENIIHVLLSSFDDVKWHLYLRLLTRDEADILRSDQCVIINWCAHQYALVIDFQNITRLSSVTAYVTANMLRSWQINADDAVREAIRFAKKNIERELSYGISLTRCRSMDVADGQLDMYNAKAESVLAARYVAGFVTSEDIICRIHTMIGPCYIYLIGSDDVIICKKSDLAGLDTRTPLWYGRCYPPKVDGPVLYSYDGQHIGYCAYDIGKVPPRSYSKQVSIITDTILNYI